jgi:hypothetical protein
MLGWQVYINKHQIRSEFAAEELLNDKSLIATWITGVDGLSWLYDLVKDGQALYLGGSGYPIRFTAKAAILKSIVTNLPKNYQGSTVIGDDYVHFGGFNQIVKIYQKRMDSCKSDEVLSIEAWDQS